jgi:hypothetical protein
MTVLIILMFAYISAAQYYCSPPFHDEPSAQVNSQTSLACYLIMSPHAKDHEIEGAQLKL